jgi:hypothetical protein
MRTKSFLAFAILSLSLNTTVFAQNATPVDPAASVTVPDAALPATTVAPPAGAVPAGAVPAAAVPDATAAVPPATGNSPALAPWGKRDFVGLIGGASGVVEVKGDEKFIVCSNNTTCVPFKNGDTVVMTLSQPPRRFGDRILTIAHPNEPGATINLGKFFGGSERMNIYRQGKIAGEGIQITSRTEAVTVTPLEDRLHTEGCHRFGIETRVWLPLPGYYQGTKQTVVPTVYVVNRTVVTIRSVKTGKTLVFTSNPEAIEVVEPAKFSTPCK